MLVKYISRNSFKSIRVYVVNMSTFSILLNLSFAILLFQNFAVASPLNQIIIADGSSLTLNSNSDFDDIDGEFTDSGILNISNQSYIYTDENQHIGRNQRLAQINISESSMIFNYGEVNAAQINLNNSSMISLRGSSFDEMNFTNESMLLYLFGYLEEGSGMMQMDGNIVVTNSDSKASIFFSNYNSDDVVNVKINGSIGSFDKKVEDIFVDNNTTLDLSDSLGVFAKKINLCSGNHQPTIILGSGIVDSEFIIDRENSIARIRVIEDHNLISSVGSEESRVEELTVEDNLTLNVRNSVYTNSITNNAQSKFIVSTDSAGDLNIVDSLAFHNNGLVDLSAASNSFSGRFGGAVSNYTGSTFKVGSNAITIPDSVIFETGSIISINANSPTEVGSISSDIVQIEEGVMLSINIADAHDWYDLQNSQHVIVESVDKDASNVNQIQESNIMVNSIATNKIGLLTFSTSVVDNNLLLDVERGAVGVDYNDNQLRVINTVDSIGQQSTGEMLAVQTYLNTDPNATIASKKEVANSLMPRMEALAQNSFNASDAVFKAISSRIFSYQLSKAAGNKKYRTVDSNGNEVESLDDSSTAQTSLIYGNDFQLENNDLARHFWIQLIGSRAKQADKGGFEGYDLGVQGLVIGVDNKIDSKTLVGASFATTDSSIDSSNKFRNIDSRIYQLSVYVEKEMAEKSYYSLMAAASKGTNDSSRFIPIANRTAAAQFDSQNYSLKGSIYQKMNFENGFDIVPQIGVGYLVNKVDDYQEQGAGTLNLNVKTDNLEMLNGSLAITTGYKKKFRSFIIYPKIKLSYEYDFFQDIQTSVSNFQGQDLSFATRSTRVDPSTIRIAAGLEVFESEDLSFNAQYIQERRTSFSSHTGVLEARFAF